MKTPISRRAGRKTSNFRCTHTTPVFLNTSTPRDCDYLLRVLQNGFVVNDSSLGRTTTDSIDTMARNKVHVPYDPATLALDDNIVLSGKDRKMVYFTRYFAKHMKISEQMFYTIATSSEQASMLNAARANGRACINALLVKLRAPSFRETFGILPDEQPMVVEHAEMCLAKLAVENDYKPDGPEPPSPAIPAKGKRHRSLTTAEERTSGDTVDRSTSSLRVPTPLNLTTKLRKVMKARAKAASGASAKPVAKKRRVSAGSGSKSHRMFPSSRRWGNRPRRRI
jgi:hypothetical protein